MFALSRTLPWIYVALCASVTWAWAAEPLKLEAKITLGKVTGRIDHLAIDLPRQRLFIAELGNNTVGIIDLRERKLIHTIQGLKNPQGVGYHQSTDTLYVSNASDGSIRMFRGPDYSVAGQIDLNDDADNIRIDTIANRIVVGYGKGGLAIIDPESRRKIADVRLNAHPEGFQLHEKGQQIFVNVPAAHAIAVVDRVSGHLEKNWPVIDARDNFPMAIDEMAGQVVAVFRDPAMVRAYSMQTGTMTNQLETCGDSDDVFFDTKRKRLYVSCGAGYIDVIDVSGAYKRLARISTAQGARTSLFVPELDRLFLAVRARSGSAPAIWVYRPVE